MLEGKNAEIRRDAVTALCLKDIGNDPENVPYRLLSKQRRKEVCREMAGQDDAFAKIWGVPHIWKSTH